MSQRTAEPWTIKRLLEWTGPFLQRKGVEPGRLAAEMLLGHVLDLPRIKLYTSYDRVLTDDELSRFRALVQRAGEQEPIAYLTGRAPFFNLEFDVTPDVLIPRPDTETLVENVLQLSRNDAQFTTPRVLDLCTGSGCIAAAVAHRLKEATVLAVDISAAAVAVARRNVERLGLSDRVQVEVGDLYDAAARAVDPRPFDLILANPPYIPSVNIASLDRNVRDYEPHVALDGGPDGLDVHRRILAGAADRLTPGGRVFLEIQFDQGEAAKALVASHAGLGEVRVLRDYGGNDRVVTARKSG